MFGSASLFVLHHPAEYESKRKEGVKFEEVTYDLAQEEIAENSGLTWARIAANPKVCFIQCYTFVVASDQAL